MRKKFNWEDKYSVGIETIDNQHKTFFENINEAIDLLNDPENPNLQKQLILVLVKFANYAFYHLSFEEDYFIKFKYSESDSHIAEHNYYRDKMADYLKEVRSDGTDKILLAGEIVDFSIYWLETHINKVDKNYSSCFKENGLK